MNFFFWKTLVILYNSRLILHFILLNMFLELVITSNISLTAWLNFFTIVSKNGDWFEWSLENWFGQHFYCLCIQIALFHRHENFFSSSLHEFSSNFYFKVQQFPYKLPKVKFVQEIYLLNKFLYTQLSSMDFSTHFSKETRIYF